MSETVIQLKLTVQIQNFIPTSFNIGAIHIYNHECAKNFGRKRGLYLQQTEKIAYFYTFHERGILNQFV